LEGIFNSILNCYHDFLHSIAAQRALCVTGGVCQPRSVATTLCLTFSFHYLSIIKYQLYGYIIQLVLSGNYVSVSALPSVLRHYIVYIMRLYGLLQ